MSFEIKEEVGSTPKFDKKKQSKKTTKKQTVKTNKTNK